MDFPKPFNFYFVISWLQIPLFGGYRKTASSKQISGEKKKKSTINTAHAHSSVIGYVFHLLVWDNIDKGIKDTAPSPESNENSHSQITEYDISMFCNMKRKEHLIYFNMVNLKLD